MKPRQFVPPQWLESMMKVESYTPGHTKNASDFMAKRTLDSHGSFFLPYLDEKIFRTRLWLWPGHDHIGHRPSCIAL